MKTRIIGTGRSYYHVFSRISGQDFLLGPSEKDFFREMLWRVAEFSGVNILTYCIMDNHFHILLEITEPESVSDTELMRRVRCLYRGQALLDAIQELERCQESEVWRESVRQKYLRRMYDLSEFMRTLKLRFSFWFNRRHERHGTLWDGRFKSVLIEGGGRGERNGSGNLALATVAAYIDLNAVRAGIVDNPVAYAWCGCAEAAAGVLRARMGFEKLYSVCDGKGVSWCATAEAYYALLLDRGGAMIPLLQRIRAFTSGGVLGSHDFVEQAFLSNRTFFGESRKRGACRIKGIRDLNLYAARELR